MNIICLDFETYFDKDYSLRKMTIEAYVRDPRFEAHGCAIKLGPDTSATWHRDFLGQVLHAIDWSNTGVVMHHAQFDGLILSHHYGIRPKFIFCTLSMARLLVGNHLSVGLDSLAKHFGLGAKTVPYKYFEGRHWGEITSDVQALVAEGCCQDVKLTWRLFVEKLAPAFPAEEYALVDMTVRMFTEPVLVGDVDMLAKMWREENERKSAGLAVAGVSADDVQSSARLAELLAAEGVEVEYKDGRTGPVPCFAKTDEFMRELQEHENPKVRALVEARLDLRSTIDQTRAERLGFMAGRGSMCVYQRYAGAHTTRWAGGDGVNWQNFPRSDPQKPEAPTIRKAIKTPEDRLIATFDLSQIECRILEYLAGEEEGLDEFRRRVDPYINLASKFYRRLITKNDVEERQFGKVLRLQCGFGAGGASIVRAARNGRVPVYLTDEEGDDAKHLYRSEKRYVVALWSVADGVLRQMARNAEFEWGPMLVKDRHIFLPNGAPIIYDTLEWFNSDDGDRYWRVRKRAGWTKLYGAKLVENVVQALARVVMSQAMLRIAVAGLKIVNTEHDKVAVLVRRDGLEQEAYNFCLAEMRREPAWLPGIPLDAEGHMGERYEK